MSTRKELIEAQYVAMCNDLRAIVPESIAAFPSLDEYDLSDLVFFMATYYSDKTRIRESTVELMELYGLKLSDEQMSCVLPRVETFVLWFKNLE
jgi:hypothetical protein